MEAFALVRAKLDVVPQDCWEGEEAQEGEKEELEHDEERTESIQGLI